MMVLDGLSQELVGMLYYARPARGMLKYFRVMPHVGMWSPRAASARHGDCAFFVDGKCMLRGIEVDQEGTACPAFRPRSYGPGFYPPTFPPWWSWWFWPWIPYWFYWPPIWLVWLWL